ncbi:Uncharacterised protein [Legionella sainthelensi]|nr:Uncharacterised protein [Legionella sainthelensi]
MLSPKWSIISNHKEQIFDVKNLIPDDGVVLKADNTVPTI